MVNALVRDITADDIQAAYADIAQKSVTRYNVDRTASPQLIMVWFGSEPGQIKKTEQTSGPWLDLLSDDRQMLREMIRGLLRGPGDRPQLVVQTTLVSITVYRGKTLNSLERMQDLVATEGIMTAVHTLEQTYGAVSQIDPETSYCSLAALDLGVTYAGQLSMAEAPSTRH